MLILGTQETKGFLLAVICTTGVVGAGPNGLGREGLGHFYLYNRYTGLRRSAEGNGTRGMRLNGIAPERDGKTR